MIIGCTGNYRKKEFFIILDRICEIIAKEKNKLIISDDLMKSEEVENYDNYSLLEFDLLAEQSDVICAIGGDGTILSTVRRLGINQKPIMGIHIGGLGFLSECIEDDLKESINHVINDDYGISNRMLLEVLIIQNDKEEKYYALNDIVIDHGPSARILKIEVNVSNNYLNTYEGDGLIFSTPTGSTAYSLSAGGPIIYPDVETITVTPISPHSLSARAIVLQAKENIELKFPETNDGMAVIVDGQLRFKINDDVKIKIARAQHYAQLIQLPKNSYYDTLRTKMGWLGNVR